MKRIYTVGLVAAMLLVLAYLSFREPVMPVAGTPGVMPKVRAVAVGGAKEDAAASHVEASQSTSDLRAVPLNQAELTRLSLWMKERGYMFDLNSTGGNSAFTGYESTDSSTLRQLARSGDARAAMVLSDRLFGGQLPAQGVIDEVTELLGQASTLGYTASIQKLSDLKLLEASRPGTKGGIDRALLVDGYAYALVLSRRGDINAEDQQATAKMTSPLTQTEQQQARARADEIYSAFAVKRQSLGMPPFVDGLPPDIEQLGNRFRNQLVQK